MKKKVLLFAFLCLVLQINFAYAQTISVSGTITSAEDKRAIIGAYIEVKGSTTGTMTDLKGEYTIQAPEGATLVCTYIGMKTVEVVVNQAVINIEMETDPILMDEVVVTAMGVTQEKKNMNFAVQTVSAEDLTAGRSSNFVDALQGKVAGVSVTTAGGSPTAGSSMIIRGISSINSSQSNEPLYVLDGIPYTGGPDNINPNDIANITVLKGAAASALYGQQGANGVVMITTKKATAGQLNINFSASVQFDTPARLIETQNVYGPGALGFYQTLQGGGWGPPLAPDVERYNNVKNFFGTGFYHKYDLNLTGGTDKLQSYASVNYSKHDGIVVNDYLQKVGLLLKGSYKPIKQLTFDVSANITNNQYRGPGSIESIYSWPINDDITDYKNPDGTPRFRYLLPGLDKEKSPVSPLWSRYQDAGLNSLTANVLSGSVTYNPIKGLGIIGRLSHTSRFYDYDGYAVPLFDDSIILDQSDDALPYFTAEELAAVKDKAKLGEYSYRQSASKYLDASLLATYHLDLPKEFTLDLLAGTMMQTQTSTASAMSGRDFLVPGIYSITNVKYMTINSDVTLTHREKRLAAVYGEVRGGYKDIATLSVTARNDWSSTLRSDVRSYFYPSVTGGLIFSEMFKMTNKTFSFGKIRANFALVGKDTQPYLFDRRYSSYNTLPDGGFGVDPGLSTSLDLKPEMTTTWEIGADLRFFEGKTRLDIAYYSTKVSNQIVTVRVSPSAGYILLTRNEGDIKNHGLEATFEQDIIDNTDMSWTVGLNFALNRGVVTALPEGMFEVQGGQYGDIFATAFLDASTTSLSGKDYARTPDGQIICDENGYPKIDASKSVLIGNREPKFRTGLSTNFRYKNFSVSALFDARVGGDIANITGRGLTSSGMHKSMEFYRGRQVVWDGVVEQADGSYVPNTTPIVLDNTTITNYYSAVSSNFIEKGSYLRLGYVTLSYDLSSYLKKTAFKTLKASITGTNLFLLTKYSGSDPSLNANVTAGGTGASGIDNYAVPSTRGFNFTLTAGF